MNDDMATERTISLGTNMVPEGNQMVATVVDHKKRAWDMYTSDDWVKIIMENCNEY